MAFWSAFPLKYIFYNLIWIFFNVFLLIKPTIGNQLFQVIACCQRGGKGIIWRYHNPVHLCITRPYRVKCVRWWPGSGRYQGICSQGIDTHQTYIHTDYSNLTHWGRDKNGRHFTDSIFKCIFLNKKAPTLIQISLNLVPKFRINNKSALNEIMACRL